MRRSRAGWRWLRSFWGRWFALFLLIFAAPGSVDVVQDLVAFVSGAGCCDSATCEDNACAGGACDGAAGDCCPKTCVHCACCAHSNALPALLAIVPTRTLLSDLVELRAPSAERYAPGYRVPPFRPPAA